jgi:hypothetical protein
MKWLALCLLLLLAAGCVPVSPIGPLDVTLVADGETCTMVTEAQTVRDLLDEAGIILDENDRVTPPENTFLTNGVTVRVVRVVEERESERITIPYGRETVRDVSIPTGETRLLRAGANGIEEIVYAITLEDGVEVDRRVVQRSMVQETENEVILIGAQQEVTAIPISGTITYLSAHNAWVMRNTTGNRRRLTLSGDLDGRVFDLSPDGAWLLFTRTTTDTETLNTLWMVDTTTADADPVRLNVEDILWAAWSPDGEQIAYSTGEAQESPAWEAANDLYVARPRARDGLLIGRRRVLEPSAGGTYGWWGTTYAWGPGEDPELMAYARADEVGVIRLSDGESVPLIHFPPYRTYAPWVWTPSVSWSPDGTFVATVVHGPSPAGEMPEDSPVFDIYVLGVAEEERGVLTTTVVAELVPEAGMWAVPSFSPEGERILFTRARIPYNSNTSDYDLYVMDRDGSGRQPFFATDPHEPGLKYQEMAWDPYGEQVLVIFQGDLYLVSPGGQSRRITDNGATTQVRWASSPEGERD